MAETNKKQNKIVNYFNSSIEELKKVKWPTKNEVVNNTILVVIICIFMAIFLGLLDFGLTHLVEWMISFKK
ncbi:MAG: preprotein translocase subunit SecE [Patescibacteria group bacterium]